ncbi:MAG: hypothetical protein PHT27_08020, partial [Candidatus Izemoplasmatales bacterium]|nr:hypothetical protein [Candidatus Izemoplasmatales bacterium]
ASVPDVSKEVRSGKIELTVDSKLPDGKWGITQGIPFPCGTLRNAENTRMEDGRNLQRQALAYWPDGSIKWLQVSTLASSHEKLTLLYGREIKEAAKTESSLKVEQTNSEVSVGNGKLSFKIPFEGETLIKDIVSGKNSIESAVLSLNSDSALGKREVKIEESGPVRTAIRISGKYPKHPELSYIVRIFVYENSNCLELEHSIILGEKKNFKIENCGIFFRVRTEKAYAKPGEKWLTLGNAENGINFEADVKTPESAANNFPFEIKEAGKKIFSGKNAAGILKVTGAANVGFAVRNFWQNVPESMNITSNGIGINCISKEVTFWHGMAKTHNVLLDFSEGGNASEVFMQKALLLAPSDWYCNSKAFHAWPLAVTDAKWKLYEDSVENTIKFWEERFSKNMASSASFKNMMFFGETGLGASNNMETALGEGAMVQYLRSGKRSYFDFAEMMISHFADVDIDHSDGKSKGHIYIHGPYERKETEDISNGHSWFNGTLLYGFFTASKRIMEIGDDVGKYHSGVLPKWDIYEYVHYWRKPAWQLMCIIQGWDATGNWNLLKGAKNIVELTKAQRDHIISLWPYMFSIGMKGLREYYETTGDPEVRELYLQIFDGYMRLRTRPGDRSFGEHAKAPGMLLGNYPNDRSCSFYNEAAQADWLAGRKRYTVPAGNDMTIQLEYGINDPTFLWGSADLLRAMKEAGMPFPAKVHETPPVAMLPLVSGSPLAALKCPVIMFQVDKKKDCDFDIFLYNRPYGKYSGLYSGIAGVTDAAGKIIDSCQVRTDGLRMFKLHVPQSGKAETYTVFITLQGQWRWTIEDIPFDLMKGVHELKINPRYSRVLIDAICLYKKSSFDPFSGKALIPQDCIFVQAENSVVPDNFIKEEDLTAENGVAVRKKDDGDPLVLNVDIPEDGTYYFSARIWKGTADLLEVSMD